MVSLVAAVARYAPQKIAPSLADIVPAVLQSIQKDDEDLREGALQALETTVLRCPSEVTPFINAIIAVGVQFIKYDPVRSNISILSFHVDRV